MPELDILSILLIALALSADCFAVAISGSVYLKTISLVPVVRTAATFGGFQAVMMALGWLAGHTVVNLISDYDHWLAFILLALIGGRMIWEAFHHKEKQIDISKGILLITLAIATSIDALAVGLSFAFLKVNIVIACLIIGLVAFGVTIAGFTLGAKIKKLLGKYAEVAGGIILIAIGIRVLFSHTL